mmetsp:Transcript_14864/g.33857  ORF Transcript_14864/g.33857 Transcript_14864/m.33857 type:complete len:392 (+) Transcript_14864:96-1271(+)
MGIDFRGKGYVRRVRFGKRTVKEGEAVAVWDENGRHRQIVGPKLVRLWFSTIRFLDNHIAGNGQYLRISKRDGTIEHRKGPTSLFENPVYHTSVSVEDALELRDSSSYLVVRKETKTNAASSSSSSATDATLAARDVAGISIVQGPTLYFPEPSELVHTFAWSAKGAGASKSAGRVVSTSSGMAKSLPVEAQDANGRTAYVSIDWRAKLSSIDAALRVADPVAECDLYVRAFVLEVLSVAQFAEQGTSLLTLVRNAVESDRSMESLKAAVLSKAGCELIRVDVTDVKPSEELSALRKSEDQLSAARMQEQLAGMNLEASAKRLEREQQLEVKKQEHELQLAAREHEASLQRNQLDNQGKLAYMKELRALGVDMTKYLCAVASSPAGAKCTL